MMEEKIILVVDDDASNRELVVSTIMKYSSSFKVYSASDGNQVFDILAKKKVDIIILDWEMPKLDGFATLKQLKSLEQCKEIPVLMYTGVMTATENLIAALEHGAADFIRKPVEPIEIIARVQSVLNLKDHFDAKIKLEIENADLKSKILENEINTLREQLNTYLLQLLHKNKILGIIKTQLESTEFRNNIESVKNLIERELNSESYWEEFFIKLKSFDKDFINKLLQKFPDLSPGEIKLCSLLRLGISSKDIAIILNVNAASIDKNRYRLRKKLNLETDQNLDQLILSL